MHPVSQPASDDTVFIIFMGLAFLIVGIVYIMPSIIAFRRNHPNRWIILVINVAFGGTIIGWGIALVWAMRAAHQVGSNSSGGESGLNLFVNDVKKIQVVEPPSLPQASLSRVGAPARPLRQRRDISSGVRWPKGEAAGRASALANTPHRNPLCPVSRAT